ncbi:MAG: ABC transporter ATP-binding protein [Clostridiales bacterium]|nr:ABC transporter ATP-binding protein [Clostridiales bacterium]
MLKNISLCVDGAGITCLMGPNGSGKTTLLGCIMKIISDGRSISIDGTSLSKLKRSEISRRIAYIPQIHSVTFPYTVRDAVLMGRMAYAGLFGSPEKSDFEACERAMEQAGISGFADRTYSSLSGGEIRLVLLARALCQDAGIILMDEPTAFLDFRNELMFLESAARLAIENNVSVIMATHSPNHGFWFESRNVPVDCVLMSGGMIYGRGTPSEIITESSIKDVYGVESRIISDGAEKSVVMTAFS